MGSTFGNGHCALAEEVPVGYKRTEVGVIPEEWQATRIGDLFESTAGGDFDPTRSSDVQSDSHPYPIYANGLSQEGLYGFCNYAENRPGSITVTARGTLGKAFYRDTQFVAIGRLLVLEPKVRMDARFFFNYINYGVHFAVESTGVPQLTAPQVARYLLPVPPESEQRTIAEALSDVDRLLAALEVLIAKKRAVKQAAMQQLLTGKSRLPGFSGTWETKRLEHIVDCLDHVRIPLNETQRANMLGLYPYCGANGVLDYVNDFVLDDDVILIAEDGGYFDEYTHRPIAYRMSGKIWVNNHAHILKAKSGYSQGFLYFSLVHKNILPYLASGTRAKLNKSEMNKIEIYLPLHYAEQEAIAAILSDMDAEIAVLERRRDKTRAVKQGMMQQLLTGRVRLVKPDLDRMES